MAHSAHSPLLTMNDGKQIPQLGFGVCAISQDNTAPAVEVALKAGYRHIDTATIYKNERQVGKAVRTSGIAREDVFVTTKLWNTDQGRDSALEACEKSLELLGMDYVDLYLIHWAQPGQAKYRQSWESLLELRERGLVKSVGVSNFTSAQLDEIIADTGVTPVVNQIETHPFFNQAQQRAENAARSILTEAWSPLGQGSALEHPELVRIAKDHNATVAQVIIAWHLAAGNVVIPKSQTPQRIVSNFEAPGVTLTAQDIETIDSLTRTNGRLGGDPAEGDLGAPFYSDRPGVMQK